MKNRLYIQLFLIIFLSISIFYIFGAETSWFPIVFEHTDSFIIYITNRHHPFDYFKMAFKLIHIFFITVFFLLTIFHIILYHYLWVSNKVKSSFLKWLAYAFGMFVGGYLIYFTNQLYWDYPLNDFDFILDTFLNYIWVILNIYNVIVFLYLMFAFYITYYFHNYTDLAKKR